MISEGNTKGCFQLESRLGQMMAKKLKPENIEQLAALISILRPGCLEAVRDNKTVSNHYIDKKNGLESVDYFHPSLEDILSTTYGEMIYQEQSMQIAQKLADFDLKEADMLRKAIGKKKPEEMAKIKKRVGKEGGYHDPTSGEYLDASTYCWDVDALFVAFNAFASQQLKELLAKNPLTDE